MKRRAFALAAAGIALASAACGGGGSSGAGGTKPAATTTVPTSPATAASSAPTALDVSVAPWRLPSPVSREVVVTDGKQLEVLGGQDASHASTGAVYTLDPATGASADAGRLNPAVHDAAGVRLADAALVIAGGTPPARATVQAVGATGTRLVGQLPAARTDHVATIVGATVYALGGADAAEAPLGDVVASTDGAAWRAAGSLAEPVRYPAIATVDGAVYLFGGVGTSHADTASIQRYDPATGSTQVVGQLPARLSHASTVVLGGQVFVLGGFVADQPSTQVLRFDPMTGGVAPAGALPAPLTDGAAVVIGDAGYLVGGEGPGRATAATVEVVRAH